MRIPLSGWLVEVKSRVAIPLGCPLIVFRALALQAHDVLEAKQQPALHRSRPVEVLGASVVRMD